MHTSYAFLQWPPPATPFADSEDLRDWQRWRCAMCGTGPVIECDHDHRTGLVRGYLCRDCNRSAERRLPWCTGTTPAGTYGLVELYRNIMWAPKSTRVDTADELAALFAWDGHTFDGHKVPVSDTERFRALGYVLAMVRRVHADRAAGAIQ